MSLVINEIFYSIQGESLHTGLPCVFVRLTGCNLRCAYCDTRYAYEEGLEMEVPDIIKTVASYRCSLVEITGGEPLYQMDTPVLIDRLIESEYHVLMETNGTFNISSVDERCVKVVDFKCPSSGQVAKNDPKNLKRLTENDQIKFVIGNREDYDYAKHTKKLLPTGFPGGHILFSPAHGILKPKTLASWMLEDKLNARLHLQIHKLIWPNIDRGV